MKRILKFEVNSVLKSLLSSLSSQNDPEELSRRYQTNLIKEHSPYFLLVNFAGM